MELEEKEEEEEGEEGGGDKKVFISCRNSLSNISLLTNKLSFTCKDKVMDGI